VQRFRAPARRGLLVVTLTSPLIAFACSAFDSSRTADPIDASMDDTTADGGVAGGDATNDAADALIEDAEKKDQAAPGTVFTDDFELTAQGCGPVWQPLNSNLSLQNGAGLDGGTACRICRQLSNSYSMRKPATVKGKAGETYYAEVYVRDEIANDSGAFGNAGLRLSYVRSDGGTHQLTFFPYVGTSWSRVQGNITFDSAGDLTVSVEGQSTVSDDCIFADRVSVIRQP
jgi:hypothetical protein